jgi:hypothetical protein
MYYYFLFFLVLVYFMVVLGMFHVRWCVDESSESLSSDVKQHRKHWLLIHIEKADPRIDL